MGFQPEVGNVNRKSTLPLLITFQNTLFDVQIKSLSRTVQKLDDNNVSHFCRSTMKNIL